MSDETILKLLEHNNWANRLIIEACYGLSDDQLDGRPQTSTKGTIRETVCHLVTSQRGYLALLTLPPEERPVASLAFDELLESARVSGEGLVELVSDPPAWFETARIRTWDGYLVEPWVVLVQVINHATEHREQVKCMISDLGLTPPDIDGWSFGEANLALVPIAVD